MVTHYRRRATNQRFFFLDNNEKLERKRTYDQVKRKIQTSWQKNRNWLAHNSEIDRMTCSVSFQFNSKLSSSSNLGTGFTRECIRFRENFAQCRATQQSSTDYLQVKLYTGGSWSSYCQEAP